MNKLAIILEDFCGCTGPAFDSKTGRLTTEGDKAYQILKNIISKLGELEIIDAKNAHKKLDNLRYGYLLAGRWDYSDANIKKIAKATVGKSLFQYDSWNGSSMTIVIEDIELQNNAIHFTGTNHWGGKSGIYVNRAMVGQLLATGKAEQHNTLEGCDIVTRWSLNDTSN